MRILAIDPGYDRVGVAIVENSTSSGALIYSTCIQTSKESELHDRLVFVGEEVSVVIDTYHPDVLAIEKLYMSKNQKTAMGVAQARGVILYLAGKYQLSVVEYTPQEIKQAVTGYGRATKHQVMQMVPKLIPISEPITSDDEMDAVAVGITALAHMR